MAVNNKLSFITNARNTTDRFLFYKFAKGDRVRINGEVFFGQDFSWWKGTFDDLIFEIDHINHDETNRWFSLKAPGYGGTPGTNDYGNGSIHVYEKDFNKLEKIDIL